MTNYPRPEALYSLWTLKGDKKGLKKTDGDAYSGNFKLLWNNNKDGGPSSYLIIAFDQFSLLHLVGCKNTINIFMWVVKHEQNGWNKGVWEASPLYSLLPKESIEGEGLWWFCFSLSHNHPVLATSLKGNISQVYRYSMCRTEQATIYNAIKLKISV